MTIHLRKKRKAYRKPYNPKLSLVDYDEIAISMQESLEESMAAIVKLAEGNEDCDGNENCRAEDSAGENTIDFDSTSTSEYF